AAQLEQAETRAAEYLDSLQRERATFQNYKRRVERERTEQAQTIARNILSKLLPVIDDFHRAMDAVPEGERDQWFEGVLLIQRKLDQLLTNEGVTEIEALGAPFDPAYHEAIGVDTESEAESGTVTQVLQRGYQHKDRVLRPAMVRVAE
ncbi:MAG: nucleotide exchange factor GrpE, partial [Anaerolineae bacterium]|nr:nucleotide exchange factor GrpE [Anaerolineae bacterium]